MQPVDLPGLGGPVAPLGLGCASLGSRVGARAGQRALDAAFDAGVTWFDLAPAYGAGQAETLFAPFARRHRDAIQICTKAGLAPPRGSALKRAIMPVARQVVAAIGPLRQKLRRARAMTNQRLPLTPELVRTSLENSLTRLGVEQVDVYALHNAYPEDLDNDALLRALEGLVQAGKTRTIATASSHETAEKALTKGAPFGIVQFAQPGTPAGLIARANAAGIGTVTHSVFGVDGQRARLDAALEANPALKAQLAEAGFADPAALLLARARHDNPQGVVLASMMSARSRAANLAAWSTPFGDDARALWSELGL